MGGGGLQQVSLTEKNKTKQGTKVYANIPIECVCMYAEFLTMYIYFFCM